MRKVLAVLLVLLFVASASAKSATFNTDQTQTVTINNEEVSLELIGVDQHPEYPELYTATFLNGEGMTLTVLSWNAHQRDRVQSQINGEYVGMMKWQGADTDSNEDDKALLAWGSSYFPCENYQAGENEFKFCEEEEKTLTVNNERINLEFQYVRTDQDHTPLKHAAFLNQEDMTLTLSTDNANQYDHALSSINGRTAYLTQTRGSETGRSSDDAVVLKIQESTVKNASINADLKERTTVTFSTNAESSIGLETIEWDLNNDNQYEEEGRTVEKTFEEPGEKTVGLRVSDGQQTETDEKTIEIKEDGSYEIQEYDTGEKVTLETGEGLKFEGQTMYFEEVVSGWAYGWANRVVDMGEASQQKINRHRFGVAEDKSTSQKFGSTDYAIAGCNISGSQATFVVQRVSEIPGSWPESNCEETENTGYSTREAEEITDFLGDNVENVTPKTEIKFGNQQQNSLFVKEINGDYMREIEVVMAASRKSNDEFELTWENYVNGVTKEFQSGEYTVHLCGDKEAGETVKIAISKQKGTNGYSACFTEKVAEENDFQAVGSEYSTGETVEASPGDRLIFGPNNMNQLYIEGVTQNRWTRLDSYANRLIEGKKARPLVGTHMETYFYTGEYNLHFCSYSESNEQIKIAVTEQQEDTQQVCEQDVERPSGTLRVPTERIPGNSMVPVNYSINTEGSYQLEASINGDHFYTSSIRGDSGEYSKEIDPTGTGNMTVELVAPGSWWNPLDSTEVVSRANLQVYEESSGGEGENGDRCQSMIDNAEENAEGKSCAQVSTRLSCPSGDREYSSPNSCETSYLLDKDWDVVETEQNAEVSIVQEEYTKGETAEITVTQGEGRKLVVNTPGSGTEEYSISRNQESFDIETGEYQVGQYTVEVLPRSDGGLFSGIVGDLIEGPVDSGSFEVIQEATWKSYCSDEGFSTETVDGQISCMENEIVPNCFNQSAGATCRRVAEDVCNDLLDYSYNSETAKCAPR